MNATAYAAHVPDTSTTREKHRRGRSERKRKDAIENVMERLDVYAVILVAQQYNEMEVADKAKPGRYVSLRREQATRIVDAVLGLTRE